MKGPGDCPCLYASWRRCCAADVLYKTFMEVNEEGTVATAVTEVEIRLRCLPPPPFTMVVDRPFFCALRDNETGTLLFVGLVMEPQ